VPGDRVRLGVERFSDLPRSSSFGKRAADDVTAAEEFTVAAVLPPDAPGNDFNLTPNPAAPLNVFVPIRTLSRLVTDDADPGPPPCSPPGPRPTSWTQRFGPRTCGRRLRPEAPRDRPPQLPQRRVGGTDPARIATVAAIRSAAAELGLYAEPTVIYVADTLAHGAKEIPYPVVAGLNPAAAEPLGPFLPKGVETLADDEVVLLEWQGSELNGLPVGTKLRMTYFDPEVEGEGLLKATELTLRGYIPLTGPARDRDLTPEIRGVTDVRAELHDWDRPPVLPREKIRERVPDKHPRAAFFNTNKATPMAYVNLATGEKLFASRYGSVTSVRIAPAANEAPEELAERFAPVLLKHLDPNTAGLTFEPVRERLLTASRGGTDFGGLFLGFSLFLIAAALMLVGLLFRLTLDRRAKEVGLLLAAGYRVPTVRRLLLVEGLALAVIGALLGLALGVAYNRLLLAVLLDLWPDREVANVLRPHASALSFALGFGLTVLMSLGALWLSVRGLVKVPPPALLRGETQAAALTAAAPSRLGWWLAVGCLPLGIALVVAGGAVTNPDYQAMTFFAGGGLLLTAGLAALWGWMKGTRHAVVTGRGAAALGQLGGRNAARNPTRSLLTAGLLAAAAFLIVAVESFRRQPGAEFLDKHGGSGGFNLLAEADVPLFQPFDSGPGRAELDERLREAGADPAVLDGTEAFALRLRPGDDVSCMNLFQATRPRVLGVPDALIDRGGFKFYATEASTSEERANPWLLLRKPAPNNAIPVFCEQNTAQWMLKKAVGDELTMPGDDGTELTLRIVGTFADSPFQSELLMADDAFVRAFPGPQATGCSSCTRNRRTSRRSPGCWGSACGHTGWWSRQRGRRSPRIRR
jgi:putative ABC transport system permease protein